MRIFVIVFSILFINPLFLWSQSKKEQERKAHQFFKEKQFTEASKLYEQIWESKGLGNAQLIEAAQCFLKENKSELVFEALDRVKNNGRLNKEQILMVAQFHHQMNNFYEAARWYKNYLSNIKKSDEIRIFMEQEVLRCLAGEDLKKLASTSIVEPLGSTINTEEDEFAPIPSVNFSNKYYFSSYRNLDSPFSNSKDKKKAFLYSISDENGIWTSTQNLGPNFVSPKNEKILDIIQNGNGILGLRWIDGGSGELVVHFSSGINENADIWNKLPLDLEFGDQDLSVFQDSIIIFSSKRLGGYGGYDLYLSVNRNGLWSEPMNLGKEINTPFNEISPFIAKDGLTIYFSSDNLQSIGGYDIFKIRYRPESNSWSNKENIGIPINSAGNDSEFRLNRQGTSAVFSSDRWNQNKGGKDIYIAYFKDEVIEQVYEEAGTLLPLLLTESKLNDTEVKFVKADSIQVIPTYSIDILNAEEDNFLANQQNEIRLLEVLKLLKKYSDIKLILIGHLNQSSNENINLFYSVKKSEQVMNYLLANGIDKLRLTAMGCGSGFPLCKSEAAQVNSSYAKLINNRIEFKFVPAKNKNFKIEFQIPKINNEIKLFSVGHFEQITEGIRYSILYGESTQLLNKELVSDEQTRFVVLRNGKYYYYQGIFKDFKSTENFIQKNNLEEAATIHAFYNGEYLDQKDLIQFVGSFPDLILLMNYYKN